MNLPERLLAAIKAEESSYALQALKNPGGKTLFDFGQRVGYLAGLSKAEELLLALLKDERDGGDDL